MAKASLKSSPDCDWSYVTGSSTYAVYLQDDGCLIRKSAGSSVEEIFVEDVFAFASFLVDMSRKTRGPTAEFEVDVA